MRYTLIMTTLIFSQLTAHRMSGYTSCLIKIGALYSACLCGVCVNGVVNTFNPQMARSGVIIDTLAAQLYDRLLDVDPYTYRLYLRHDVPFQTTDWFTPTRPLNADDVIFSLQRMLEKPTRIMTLTAVNTPISPVCSLPMWCKASTMLTLAIITEVVFSWPGLGRWLVDAIRQQDYSAISAGVMVSEQW